MNLVPGYIQDHLLFSITVSGFMCFFTHYTTGHSRSRSSDCQRLDSHFLFIPTGVRVLIWFIDDFLIPPRLGQSFPFSLTGLLAVVSWFIDFWDTQSRDVPIFEH